MFKRALSLIIRCILPLSIFALFSCEWLAPPGVYDKLHKGSSWHEATSSAEFSSREAHTSVVFNNKMWVIGGYGVGGTNNGYLNDVWYSYDGTNWSEATANAGFSPRAEHTTVAFNNKIWVIGGYATTNLDDVWYSSDGVTWVQEPASGIGFSARCLHASVVFNNKMWVIGGYDGTSDLSDVWYSTDGANWTQATSNAVFPSREGHTLVSTSSVIWLVGGYSDASYNYLSDVWYSADGKNWSEATHSASFDSRTRHTSVIFNFENAMWVIGGYDINVNSATNDVWYSPDGTNWTEAASSAGFDTRYAHTSVVFNNAMWVIGGYNDNNYSYYNDVWYSQ